MASIFRPPSFFRKYCVVLGALGSLLGVVTSSHAADGDLVWAKAIGGTTIDIVSNVAVDSSANVYTSGRFTGTVDFDPGTGTTNLTATGASEDIFVLKLDNNGNFVWARRMGGAGSDSAAGIAVDSTGNVYTTGAFSGTVDFDPSAGVTNLTAAGDRDIFVSKLDTNGNFVWARRMGGSAFEVGRSISVDSAANVYTTGTYSGAGDYDPGAGTFNLTWAGGSDVFVQKLNSGGNFVWARRLGGPNLDSSNGIAVDVAGNVYTTGRFFETVDFDPGAGTVNLTANGVSYDMFVQKLDSSGNFLWVRRTGGGPGTSGEAIQLDASNNVYCTGFFGGTADFDPGAATFNLTATGPSDAYVLKLNASGNFLWARRIGGTDSIRAQSLALDSLGNVYSTGYFVGTADFDPGAGTSNLVSAGQDDGFVLKLNNSGNFVWVAGFAGASSGLNTWLATDSASNVYVTGVFTGATDFDPGPGTSNLSPAGQLDGFIVKLSGPIPAAPSNPSAFEIALTSITWTWQDNSNNETGFKVYADPGVGPPTTLIATTGTNATARSYGSQGVNTQHAMQVQATISGNDSAKTSTITRWTLIEPVAGLALSNIGITSIDVVPTNTPSNLGSGSSGLRFVNTTAGTASTWQQNTSPWISDGLIPNTSYVFAGTSRNGAGVETAPAMVSAWTLAATPLAPVLSNPTVSTLDLSVAPGDANPAGTQYALQDVSSGNWVQADGTLAASPLFQSAAGWGVTTLTGLAPATAYSYVAVARNGAGVLTASSAQGQGTTMDATAPDAIAITPATTGPTNATTVGFSVEFDEAVVNFNDASDLDIAHIGTSHGSVAFAGGPTVYTVTVSGISGDGGFTLAVSTSSDVQNSLGTSLASSVTSAPVAIDNTAPGVTIGPPSIVLTNTGPVTYSVEYLGADNIALGSGDITLNSTGSATANVTVSNSGTATRLVTLSGITGSGTLGISIVNPGTAVDLAGNASPTAGPSATFTVDNSAPQFSNLVVTPIEAEVGMVVTITFDVSKPLAGDPVVTINGSLTALSSTAPYTYVYTIESTDLTGPAMISISGTDLIGNVGSLTDTSALFIQNSVAKLPLKSWPAILVLAVVGVLVLFRHRANRKDPA